MTTITEEQLQGISIGPAYMWRIDERGASTRDERLAFMFRVSGLPPAFGATIGSDARPGRWNFSVRSRAEDGGERHQEGGYESKEAALAGIRSWIADRRR